MTEIHSATEDVDDQEDMRQAQTPTLLAHHDRPQAPHVPASGTQHIEPLVGHNCESAARLGSQRMRSKVTEDTTVNHPIAGLGLASDSAEPGLGPAPPVPRNNIARRIAGLPTKLRAITRSITRSNRTNRRPYYPSRRDAFIESAAMDREMFRL